MRRVRIFVEGGGEGAQNRAALRNGFRSFFERSGSRCEVVVCGRRDAAFKSWKAALSSEPESFNVLLVDSEGSVSEGTPLSRHLAKSDPSWQLPPGGEGSCHLMVQMMEAWFLADPEALTAYYGQYFGAKALPSRPNVEQIAKADVERSVKEATKRTRKGEYHKIRHGAELLARIDPEKVRKRAPHCERLLATLASAQAGG